MGQYYVLAIQSLKDKKIRTYESSHGLKLMEFTYYDSSLTTFFGNSIYHNPQRTFVIGDYADQKDFKNEEYQSMFNVKELYNIPVLSYGLEDFDFRDKCCVNLSQGKYIELNPDNEQNIFEPFLLCALGNGKGGGDYCGINDDVVGSWAGDIVTIVEKELIPSTYQDFEKVEISFGEV